MSKSVAHEPDRLTAIPDAAARLTDFSDWLSPVLVKELRQGLRTRVFVIAFVLLQATLSIVLLFSLEGNSPQSSYLFWMFSAVLIVGVMPLRGFAALSEEMEGNTLDLLIVTRLSSLRIAFGKWCALVVQTLLLGVTILPYILMRYFMGGIDLMVELPVFYYLLLLSCMLTALTVAFSVFPSFLTRSAIAMIAGYGAAKLTGQLLEFRQIDQSWLQLKVLITATFGAGYVSWFLLEGGVSRIAPEAESHAPRKRLASLIVVAIACSFAIPQWRGMLWALALIPAIDALCESNNRHHTAIGSVGSARNGVIHRLMRLIVSPGWSSGVFFTLLITGITLCCDAWLQGDLRRRAIPPMTYVLQWIALPAAILFPVPLLRLIERWKPVENRFAAYMLTQIVVISFCSIFLIVAHDTGKIFVALIALVWPHGLLVATLGTRDMEVLSQFPQYLVYTAAASIAGTTIMASVIAAYLGFKDAKVSDSFGKVVDE